MDDQRPVGPPAGCAWMVGLGLLLVALYIALVALGYVDAAKVVAPQ